LDLRLGSGSDSLTVAARNANYLVANTSVPARKSLVMKSGVSSKQIDFESLEVLNLNGDVGNNLFDLSRFTGNGIVNGGGGNDTLTINRGVDFTLGSAKLQAGTSSFSLANIENIKLGDDLQATPVNNRFTVSRWQGGLDLQGLGGLDSVEIIGDTDFAISNLSLKLGNLANTWSLGGIETAKLTGGISANRFSFSGWTGSGSILGGTGNDTFAFTADEDQVLTNGALVYGSGAGKTISLSGIESASLTGGQHNNFLNAAVVDMPVFLSGLGGDDVLWGGKNNDTLAGGTGKNVLVGGAGNDNLQGGSDRDLLIGGVGIDSLLGGDGDDILIGGTTSYDSNRVALDALLAAWITPTTYANRTSSMQDPSAGLPGTPKLNLTTVSDDSVTDALIGGNDRDWFFAELTQSQLGIENPVDTSDELIIDI
jgi:Ca2+-binding RTX toxin-like protein